jgi:hypothetical protein
MTATAPSPAQTPTSGGDGMASAYWIIGVSLVIAAVIGLIVYDTAQDNQEAQDKAQQLTQAFAAAGLPVPADTDQIVATLGDDGGAVCANPANALGKATLLDSMTNGASHVGRRAVIVDSRIVRGEALILQIYCPDELQAFQAKIDALKYDDTIKP